MSNPSSEIVVYDKRGGARLNLERAANSQEKEFRAALKDLERLGMDQDEGPGRPTPRDMVHADPEGQPFRGLALPPGAEPYRPMLEQYMASLGMGDIHTQVTSPGERYWEQWRNPRKAGPPRKRPPVKCGPCIVQPTTWLAPPVTAIAIDVFTPAAGVTLSAAYPGPGPCVDILSIDVPDRFIVVLDRFGNELEDHTAFGDVRFSMMRNETPIRSYGNFDVQLGRFDDPTKFGSPIILKHKDQWRLKAQSLGAVDHIGYARIMGWAFAVRQTSGDGSHTEYLV